MHTFTYLSPNSLNNYPYSIELNIHQRILSDIASSVSETDDDYRYAGTLIASKVQTRIAEKKTDYVPNGYSKPNGKVDEEGTDRVFMVRHAFQYELASKLIFISSLHPESTATSPLENSFSIFLNHIFPRG